VQLLILCKTINITYSERVFVALGVQHTIHMLHIFICSLLVYTVASTFSHKRVEFPGEGGGEWMDRREVTEREKSFDFL